MPRGTPPKRLRVDPLIAEPSNRRNPRPTPPRRAPIRRSAPPERRPLRVDPLLADPEIVHRLQAAAKRRRRNERRAAGLGPEQKALDREWASYSRAVRRARPTCEAAAALTAIAGDATVDGPDRDRCTAAAAACWQRSTQAHHKHPIGSGGLYVPSQGLQDSDVVSICVACHAFVHDSGIPAVRRYDLLRTSGDVARLRAAVIAAVAMLTA